MQLAIIGMILCFVIVGSLGACELWMQVEFWEQDLDRKVGRGWEQAASLTMLENWGGLRRDWHVGSEGE